MAPRSKPDDGLRGLFKTNLESRGFHLQSIETGGTGQGIPDTNFCALDPVAQKHGRGAGQAERSGGVEGWIEYKATDAWAVTLRPEQIGWIERRTRLGGRVFVAVRRRHAGGARRGPAVDELILLPGACARAARLGGLRDPEVLSATLGHWHHGPTCWDWPEVARLLCS